MPAPGDPNEGDQTLAPESAPKPTPTGETPVGTASDAVPKEPAPAGETLPPVANAGVPIVIRVGRGKGGQISIPIRVGPPPAAPPDAVVVPPAAQSAPVPPVGDALPTSSGTFDSGLGFHAPRSDDTAPLPPTGGAAPPVLPPVPMRPVRGPGGQITIPIRVGPPPAAPPDADTTLPPSIASLTVPTVPVPPAGDAPTSSGTFHSGFGFRAPHSEDTAPIPSFGNAGIPVPPTPAPVRPASEFGGPSSGPIRVAPPPFSALRHQDDVTVPHLFASDPIGAPVSDATHASGAQPADADATQAHGATGAADPGATLPTPAGRTVASGAVSGGISGGLSHDTAPISGTGSGPTRAPEAGTMVGRFALKGLHASGGLGEVFTARDTELNREVAVKRIKSRYADDPGSRRRFLTEAELTARLDHPGVVPVFGLVNDARGRPVYAMRFIRGETLKDEIDRYHGTQKAENRDQKTDKTERVVGPAEPKSAAPAPAQAPEPVVDGVPRTVAFRHLLSRFVSVCQAIAYAHEKGIIHRDIKPANVMVGKFGEVLVVDWGLAKSLSDGPDFERVMKATAEHGFRHDPEATDLPSNVTMAGTAVGTPAFMPPEQAAGQLDKVGPRADVYSLGATLFAILTGRAPFVGKGPNETLDLVRRGAFEPPAVVNLACPKPLDAICRKAMALNQEDRYATAQELAADVERWLSDEPVSAYKDPLFARLARWGRRHPTRVATGVSLLLAGVLATAGIAWIVAVKERETATQRDRARVAEAEAKDAEAKAIKESERARAAEAETRAALGLVTKERDNVRAAEQVAVSRYEKAVDAYGTFVHDLDQKLKPRGEMQKIREKLLLNATEGLQQLIASKGKDDTVADRTLVAAHRQMGEVYQSIPGKSADAQKAFLKAVEIAEAVKRSAARTDDSRTADARAADGRAADRDLARSLDGLAGSYLDTGNTGEALKAVNEAIRLLEPLAADKANTDAQKDLAKARDTRAKVLLRRGDTGGAVRDCKFALALRQQLLATPPDETALTPERRQERARDRARDLADSFDALAELQLRTGDTTGAEKTAEDNLTRRKALYVQFPDQPDVQRELAAAYARRAEVYFDRALMTRAAEDYGAGVAELEKLVKGDPLNAGARADLALMYGRLGDVQIRKGEVADAVARSKQARDEAQALLDADSDSAKAKRDLAFADERFGDAVLSRSRGLFVPAEAIQMQTDGLKAYQTALVRRKELAKLDPESTAAKVELARGLERIGDGKLALKDVKGALEAFGESVKMRRAIWDQDKDSASAKRDLAVGLYKQADACCAASRPSDANALSSEATKLLVDLTAANRESGQAKRDLALAYGKWGQVLAGDGRPTGALLVWQSSLERFQQLAKDDPDNVQAKEEEAAAWERLAGFYSNQGNAERALASARNAIDLLTALNKNRDTRTKAGQRQLALVMIKCGDINAEVRQFRDADKWYTDALKEVERDKGDPLLGPVTDLANEKLLFLAAVKVGLNDPRSLGEPRFANVRLAALKTIAAVEVRADRAPEAGSAADELAKIAKAPEDLFVVAKTLAGCASCIRGTDSAKDADAKRAVAALDVAITAGFRDLDALAAPEWNAVRARAPELAGAVERLKKLRAAE